MQVDGSAMKVVGKSVQRAVSTTDVSDRGKVQLLPSAMEAKFSSDNALKQIPQKGSEDRKEVVESKESRVKKSKSDTVHVLNEKQNEGNHKFPVNIACYYSHITTECLHF